MGPDLDPPALGAHGHAYALGQVQVERDERSHGSAAGLQPAEDGLGPVEVAQALLAAVGHDEEVCPCGGRSELLWVFQQAARRHEQRHEVRRVVAYARREQPPSLLAHLEGLDVVEDDVGVGTEEDEVTAGGRRSGAGLGPGRRGVVALARGTSEEAEDILLPVHPDLVCALPSEPLRHEGRPALLVVGRGGDAGERAEQLELLVVVVPRVGPEPLQQCFVHPGLPGPWLVP